METFVWLIINLISHGGGEAAFFFAVLVSVIVLFFGSLHLLFCSPYKKKDEEVIEQKKKRYFTRDKCPECERGILEHKDNLPHVMSYAAEADCSKNLICSGCKKEFDGF